MDYCKRIKRDLLQGERDYYNRKYTLTIRSIASQSQEEREQGEMNRSVKNWMWASGMRWSSIVVQGMFICEVSLCLAVCWVRVRTGEFQGSGGRR